ncbi:hypothetical protein [Simonsiella muelleri]|nr:hypothetical protein [Simonsiella muelleri]
MAYHRIKSKAELYHQTFRQPESSFCCEKCFFQATSLLDFDTE